MKLFPNLTRLLPLGLVGCCLSVASAAPTPSVNPYNEELALVFADEFDGTRLDPAVWESQSYDKGLSRDTARGPDNLEVRHGELRLHVRKEERPSGRRQSKWTAGFVYTRETIENNTLIEVRFKPGQATGVNNAFWMTSIDGKRDGVGDRYEIDIVETRQDARASGAVGRGHIAWHDWKTQDYAKNAKGKSDHIAQGIQVEHPFDRHQTWALWYGEHEMIYFLDGREVWRGQTHARYHDQYRTGVGKFAQWFPNLEQEAYGKFGQDDWSYFGGYTGDRMNIVFSNLPWPEAWSPLTDAAHGSYMAVDYVRVYRPARLLTATPTHALLKGEPAKISPGSDTRVALPAAVPLATRGEFPSYFSFHATLSSGAELAAAFGGGGARVFGVGGSVETGLRAGFAREVSTATAFPAKRRQEPWLAAGRELIWIGRYTPSLTAGGRAMVSLCVFEPGQVPEREPFFHANIDAQGNTSVNNDWHLNAKETSATGEVQWVTFANRGTAPLTVRALNFGPSYRSVSSSKCASNAVAPTADATVQGTGEPLILEILADKPGHPINKTQYGVFFEEISHAGQGGLYAELVNNRSFEDSIDSIPNWKFYSNGVARGSIALETANLLNAAQSRALRLDVAAAGTVGVANGGYWGINVVKGRTYNLSFFAKAKLPQGAFITAKLQNSDGTRTFASCQIHHLAEEWKKFTGSLTADDTDPKGRLALEITTEQAGNLWLDVVSLFPPTWKGRPNGLRPELAEMVVRMRPSIIRFPGGSYVSTDPDKAPKWLTELGPIEGRPGHPAPGVRSPWGYRHNDGLGFHELLQFAEDLGAEPIYVFQGGAAPRAELDKPETYITGEALGRLIQEILWGIEYANGAVSTAWGARRAANGHPAPFNMKFVQIGNENLSKPFHENYIRIYDAIKKKHPDIRVIWGGDWIGNNQHGYKSDGLMPEGSAAQIIDEHFYKKDNWFYENTNRYSPARYPRGVPQEAKIFLGEVSSQRDTLDAALKETAFLLGAEKYSDKVIMAVYAPLFANVNKKNWSANAINFDSSRVYGTPSYYSQVMLANHTGDINIEVAGLETLVTNKVFANATMVKSTGEVIVKIVNPEATSREILIQLRGLQKPPAGGREIVLTGPDLKAGNSFDSPMNVAPVEKQLEQVGSSFSYFLKPHSFTVLKLNP